MFITKFLKPFEVNETNTAGQFIKVMNCESAFRIKAYSTNGEVVFDTEVRAGFDVQTIESFSKLVLTSESEQKLEMWVSRHKLSYDALSTKASRANSFLVNHYGESQRLLPYDPAQAKIAISTDTEWYVGGEGVNIKNGIKVAANEIYTHESAAPLDAYINQLKTVKVLAGTPTVADIAVNSNVSQTIRKIDDKYIYFASDGTASLNNGVLDVESGQFNNYVNQSSQSGYLVCAPMLLDGGYYAFDSQSPQGSITLINLSITDGAHLGRSVINLDNSFYALSAACDGDKFIVCGAEPGERSKIYTVSKSSGVVAFTHTMMESESAPTISSVFYDAVGGKFYYGVESASGTTSEIWCSDTLFTSFSKVASLPNQLQNIEPCFSQGYAIFNHGTLSYSTPMMYDKNDNNSVKTLSPSPKAIFTDDYTILTLATDGFYQSINKGNSFTREYAFSSDEGLAVTNASIVMGDSLYMLAWGESNRIAFKLGVEDDRTTPKAVFRVLKESF